MRISYMVNFIDISKIYGGGALIYRGTECSCQYKGVHAVMIASLNYMKASITWLLHHMASTLNVILFLFKMRREMEFDENAQNKPPCMFEAEHKRVGAR